MEEMVRVTKVPGEPEAEAFCDLLRKNGIECAHRVTPEEDSAFEHISSDGMREILVHERDLDRARALLQEPEQ
jgi:putative signal transducing protein